MKCPVPLRRDRRLTAAGRRRAVRHDRPRHHKPRSGAAAHQRL